MYAYSGDASYGHMELRGQSPQMLTQPSFNSFYHAAMSAVTIIAMPHKNT